MKRLILILSFHLSFIGCNNSPNSEKIGETIESSIIETSDNISSENIKEMVSKSGSFTRNSGDFFGIEGLVFDDNTVRFTVLSLYVLGEIIDREDIVGTYDVSSNGNIITIQFSFNTNFVFVDYLVDGSKKNGKSIKEVSVPYIIKGSIKDGQVFLKDWESEKQREEREKREEMESKKEKIVEDYGIDKNSLIGNYTNREEKVLVTITKVYQKEMTDNRKSGTISGTINVNGEGKDFETEYTAYHPGDSYTFSVNYNKSRGTDNGILLTFKNDGLKGNFYNSSAGQTSQLFDLTKTNKTSKDLTTYYKINDPDGYSNLRNKPNGDIVKKVLDNEKFEVIGSEGDYKKVKLMDGTMGYIHQSRVVEIDQ